MTDWLAGWLAGWLDDWLTGWLADWLADWCAVVCSVLAGGGTLCSAHVYETGRVSDWLNQTVTANIHRTMRNNQASQNITSKLQQI